MTHAPADNAHQLEAELSALLAALWNDDILADPDYEHAARQLLLDTVGATISGLQAPVIRDLVDELSSTEPGHIPFPGSPHLLSGSMFLLAYSAAVCHFEAGEGLPVSHGRPGLHAVGAVLSRCLAGRYTLRQVLEAIALGYEVGGRLGAMLRIRPGMHVDGTWGSFAAAAALARLGGLSSGQTLAALNHVACQVPFSLYHPIAMGSIARNFYVGHGALLGSFAVQAARTGFGGPAGSITQYARLALGIDNARLPAEISPEMRLLRQGYLKPYPCTRHVHYGIEAARHWVHRHGPLIAPPERVRLRIYAEAMQYCPNRRPQSHIQAQFSLTYGLAYALLHGDFTPEAYRPEWIGHPLLRAVEDRVEVERHQELTAAGQRGCVLEITASGISESIAIESITGDAGRGMSPEQVRGKFIGLVSPVTGSADADRMADGILAGSLNNAWTLPANDAGG